MNKVSLFNLWNSLFSALHVLGHILILRNIEYFISDVSCSTSPFYRKVIDQIIKKILQHCVFNISMFEMCPVLQLLLEISET